MHATAEALDEEKEARLVAIDVYIGKLKPLWRLLAIDGADCKDFLSKRVGVPILFIVSKHVGS